MKFPNKLVYVMTIERTITGINKAEGQHDERPK